MVHVQIGGCKCRVEVIDECENRVLQSVQGYEAHPASHFATRRAEPDFDWIELRPGPENVRGECSCPRLPSLRTSVSPSGGVPVWWGPENVRGECSCPRLPVSPFAVPVCRVRVRTFVSPS